MAAALHQAFVQTNKYFERNHGLYPNDLHTGTTATVVLQFPRDVVVASVGDSRAVLCCDRGQGGSALALPLTEDHTPQSVMELDRIRSLGGEVVHSGEKLRVKGEATSIAITRSIGDFPFGDLLTAEPDIVAFRRFQKDKNSANNRGGGSRIDPAGGQKKVDALRGKANSCEELLALRGGMNSPPGGAQQQQFVVLASDGLFDVMSNDEVVYFVCTSLVEMVETTSGTDLQADAFHVTAKLLAQEAYVRGSGDNIGVCVIDLFQ